MGEPPEAGAGPEGLTGQRQVREARRERGVEMLGGPLTRFGGFAYAGSRHIEWEDNNESEQHQWNQPKNM